MESFTSKSANKNSTDQLITINGNELSDGAPIPVVLEAGTESIGKLSIDQTIPGTTNGVQINAAIPTGDNNIGNMDIASLPVGNIGQKTMAASLSVVPASDITDLTYIGNVKTIDGGNATQGAKADAAVTDPTASACVIAALKGLLKQLQGTGSGGTPITVTRGTTTTVHNVIGPLVATGISTTGSPIVTGLTGHAFKAGDVVTVDKGFAAGSQTVLTVTSTTVTVGNNANADTTGLTMVLTSSVGAEIDCTGGNALSIHAEITGTGSWTFTLMGSPTSGGTFIAQEVNWVPVTRVALTASAGIVFPAHEKYNKIIATQNSGHA